MPRNVTGVDVGSRTAKFLRGYVRGNSFVATGFAIGRHDGDLEGGWASAELDFKPTGARVGVTGRDVNVRYTRVPRVPDWQLRRLMEFEVAEIGDQSGAAVASDYNVLPELPEIEGEDVVLLAMAREALLERHAQGLAALGGRLDAFTPNAIALYNAWLRFGVLMDDTVLVANVGHENTDVILARGSDLLFARNLSAGSKLFDEALAERFGVSLRKAEELKIDLADLTPGATWVSTNAEKASRALLGPAGQLLSLLQSTVAFCKNQIKLGTLRLDRVMLCGGGSALKGLDRYLASGLSVPVERFDPFQVVDTSKLDPEAAELLSDHEDESVVALGLAASASDPDAYEIEILPAKERARREFWGGRAFLIAAAVLAAAFVGWDAVRGRARVAELEASASVLGSQLRSVRRTDDAASDIVARNAATHELVEELHALATSGEQLARVLRALDEHLPQDFWITDLRSAFGFAPDLGIERPVARPIVHVEGEAREGTDSVALAFEAFTEALRAELPEARLTESLGVGGTRFTLDLSVAAPAGAATADEADEGDEDRL